MGKMKDLDMRLKDIEADIEDMKKELNDLHKKLLNVYIHMREKEKHTYDEVLYPLK